MAGQPASIRPSKLSPTDQTSGLVAVEVYLVTRFWPFRAQSKLDALLYRLALFLKFQEVRK